MIYISTACVKANYITESVLKLNSYGFDHIELSGGTKYHKNIENDLVELKEKYSLKFLCHNYFPPPEEPFVINLASTDTTIFNKSISNIKKALSLSKNLDSGKFGFHAGFYFNPNINQLGLGIKKNELENKNTSLDQFIKAYNELSSYESNVELYIENNVLSAENFKNFECNPFMLTNSNEYNILKTTIDFKLLLDVAHLKVTCQTLGLNFKEELNTLIKITDYIHISDNAGYADTNNFLKKDSELFNLLAEHNFKDKTITLEIYDDIEKIISSYELLKTII